MKPRKPKTRKAEPNKKRVFSDQNRLRADARMTSKAINTLMIGREGLAKDRFGVQEKNVFLRKNVRKRIGAKIRSFKETKKDSNNILKAIKSFLKTDLQGQYESGFLTDEIFEKQDRGKINITKKRKNYYSNKKHYRGILAHELIHSMHLPRENIVANAVESYLTRKKRNYKTQEITSLVKKLKQALKQTNDSEYSRGSKKFSESQTGNIIGILATELETKIKISGSGLFFIREINFGKDPVITISKMAKGQYNNEIRKWQKLNPRFVKILEKK